MLQQWAIQSCPEFVTKSSGVRGRSGPCGVCYGEWSGIRYRDLSESGGATRNPLQRVEQGSGHCRDLPESSDLSARTRLGYLMEQNDSLFYRSRRSSDVFEVADESIVVGCLRC